MATDIIAQDLAARALAARPREPIAIGVLGQSNERGNVQAVDAAAYPQAFRSQRNSKGVYVPMGPAVARLGGVWAKVHDDLWDWGYDARIVNGAISGMDLIGQGANYTQSRANSTAYYQKRPPESPYDTGDFGDIIGGGNSSYFVCTTGRKRYATYQPLTNARSDGIQFTGSQTSASSPPNFSSGFTGTISGGNLLTVSASANGSIEVGHTIYNGSMAVGVVSSLGTGTGGTGTYNLTGGTNGPATRSTVAVGAPVADGGLVWTRIDEISLGALLGGGVINHTQAGRGFDTLGVAERLHEELMRMRGVTRRLVYIANAQSSLGFGATTYGAGLQALGGFFLDRGHEVLIGLSNFSPASGTTTQYGNLSTGVGNAIAALQAQFPGRVHAGANLYTAMGSTGPMAAGGAFLQADNIHLNGAGSVGPDVSGVSCAGRHVSDSFKAVLSRIIR